MFSYGYCRTQKISQKKVNNEGLNFKESKIFCSGYKYKFEPMGAGTIQFWLKDDRSFLFECMRYLEVSLMEFILCFL